MNANQIRKLAELMDPTIWKDRKSSIKTCIKLLNTIITTHATPRKGTVRLPRPMTAKEVGAKMWAHREDHLTSSGLVNESAQDEVLALRPSVH